MISQRLQDAQSLQDVVAIINIESKTQDYTPADYAALYAFSCVETEDGMYFDEIINHHLDVLLDHGAQFDKQDALAVIERLVDERLEDYQLLVDENEEAIES